MTMYALVFAEPCAVDSPVLQKQHRSVSVIVEGIGIVHIAFVQTWSLELEIVLGCDNEE